MLPKISQPVFELVLPSTKQKVKYRPFTVAEEKILLVARESGDINDIVNAYKAIIQNCCLGALDPDKLASFDMEYIFICIRAKSVGNILELTVKEDDGKEYHSAISLDEIVVTDQVGSEVITLDDESITLVLRHPIVSDLLKLKDGKQSDQFIPVFAKCISTICQGESVFETSEYSTKDMENFVTQLSGADMEKIRKFLDGAPKVTGVVKYKNDAGEEKEKLVEGLQNFFT